MAKEKKLWGAERARVPKQPPQKMMFAQKTKIVASCHSLEFQF
jgi:hypothetical protein